LKGIGSATLLLVIILISIAPSVSSKPVFIGVGVCPPWRHMPGEPCKHSVTTMKSIAQDVFGVAQSDTYTLLNEEATASAFLQLLASMPALGPDDRLYFYLNLHNGSGTAGQNASAKDDVMVFWSEKDPGIIEFAVAEGLWLSASHVARLVRSLGMGEAVVIVDACESDAVAPLFLHQHAGDDGETLIATVASAQSGQWANLNETMSLPLFSDLLAQQLKRNNGTIEDRVNAAISLTTTKARSICSQRQSMEPPAPNMTCNQVPKLHDPANLLSAL